MGVYMRGVGGRACIGEVGRASLFLTSSCVNSLDLIVH